MTTIDELQKENKKLKKLLKEIVKLSLDEGYDKGGIFAYITDLQSSNLVRRGTKLGFVINEEFFNDRP